MEFANELNVTIFSGQSITIIDTVPNARFTWNLQISYVPVADVKQGEHQ